MKPCWFSSVVAPQCKLRQEVEMLQADAIKSFDTNGTIKKEIDSAKELLQQFRKKYPLQDQNFIDNLTPDHLYKKGQDYFFKWIQYSLVPLGRIGIASDRPFVSACERIDEFKGLLRIAADPTRSLADKIDAPWGRITGMGGDRIIPKKIIASYDERTLPVFKTDDMKYFYNQIVGPLPADYDSFSLGCQYEFLTQALLKEKQANPLTKDWDNAYFMRFLYETYPPPRDRVTWGKPLVKAEPLSNIGLLFSPQAHEEMVFLFAKLHDEVGFPYITRVQAGYPDIYALDSNREPKKIEIEVLASQFDHPPEECDVIVCWENDLESVLENWPEIIQLKDYV